jgi:SWI/SNF-related matrix-associated actin-dependent regulator of chromatin subfamily A containing DEAD/H box 1
VDGAEEDIQPRKRINRGPPLPSSPNDPLNIIDLPSSPEVQRPGQRRRLVSHGQSLPSSTDDESFPDSGSVVDKPRIVRGRRPDSSAAPALSEYNDPRFIRFKLTMPTHPPWFVHAAWEESQGDVRKATELLSDSNWHPTQPVAPSSSTASPDKDPTETGKVQGLEEANRARRAEAKEKAKKSSIYANRSVLDGRAPKPSTPPPSAKEIIELTESPASPSVPKGGRRRLRRVMDSESEAEHEDSGPESRSSLPAKSQNDHRSRALEFFNTAGIDALQELTGMFYPKTLHCNVEASGSKVAPMFKLRS